MEVVFVQNKVAAGAVLVEEGEGLEYACCPAPSYGVDVDDAPAENWAQD